MSFVYSYTLPIHRSVHMTRRFVVQGCPTLISTNHVTLLITVVLKLNNSASNSVCLNEFHVATCAALNLVCLHRATPPGNTPCYVTNDELKLTVECYSSTNHTTYYIHTTYIHIPHTHTTYTFFKTPTHIWSEY